MIQFYLTFGIFLFLKNVNCFQNKTNADNERGFVPQFIKRGSNGWSTFIKPGSNGWSTSIKPGSNGWSTFIKPGSNGWTTFIKPGSNGWSNFIKPGSNGWSNFIKPASNVWSNFTKPGSNGPSFNTPRPSFNTSKPSIITERPTNSSVIPSSQLGFAEAGLKAHNTRRLTSPHYGTLLVLDDKLCKDAQSYADLLAKRDSGLQHARGTGQGENLSWQSSGWWTKEWGKDGVSAEEITEGWYEERVTGGSCAGHYTQVVWKKSVKFCMATAESRSGGTYTVARYLPPGNYNGAKNYRANVHQGFVKPC